MQHTQITPKIYVACLAAYNSGYLHGQWINANQDVDAIWDEIKAMLAKSPIANAEEWAIHDYEGFGDLRLSESEDINKVAEIAALIEEHGEAWCAYAGYIGLEYATAEEFEEAYEGEWKSEEEFAEHIAEETMSIPDHLQYYIDYERLARDLFINDYFSVDGADFKVYVFRRM